MIEDKINNILKSWNPLDFPGFIAEDEYKSYYREYFKLYIQREKLRSIFDRFIRK